MAKLSKNLEKSYESKNEKKERQISELKQFWKLWEPFAETLSTYQTVDEFMKENNLSIEDVKCYFLWENDIFKWKKKTQLLSTIIRYGEEDFIIENIELFKLTGEEKYSLARMIANIKPSIFEDNKDFLNSLQLSSKENTEIIKKLVKSDRYFDIEFLKGIKFFPSDLYDVALFLARKNHGDEICDNIDIFDKLSATELENIIYEALKTGSIISHIKEDKKVMDKVNFDAILHRLSKERDYSAIVVMIWYSDFMDYISHVDEETTKGIIEFWATDIVLKNPDKFWLKKE